MPIRLRDKYQTLLHHHSHPICRILLHGTVLGVFMDQTQFYSTTTALPAIGYETRTQHMSFAEALSLNQPTTLFMITLAPIQEVDEDDA